MKRVLLLLAVLMLALPALTGCFRSTFSYSDRGAASVTEESQQFLLNGLIGPNVPYRADKLCPGGVSSVEMYQSLGNGCLGILTFAIYTPRTVQVTCAAGGAHNFYIDDQDNVLAHEIVDASGDARVQELDAATF